MRTYRWTWLISSVGLEKQEEDCTMPVKPCGDKMWKIGHGKCEYDSKAKAERAYRGYLYQKYGKGK